MYRFPINWSIRISEYPTNVCFRCGGGEVRCLQTPSVADCGVYYPHFDTRCIDDSVPCVTRGVLLFEGGFPIQDGGYLTRVSRADKGDWADNCIFRHRQDEPKGAILDPSMGALG